MKIRPNGVIEGTPEELARYMRALQTSDAANTPDAIPAPRVPENWEDYSRAGYFRKARLVHHTTPPVELLRCKEG